MDSQMKGDCWVNLSRQLLPFNIHREPHMTLCALLRAEYLVMKMKKSQYKSDIKH